MSVCFHNIGANTNVALYDIGGQRSERKKWKEAFESVNSHSFSRSIFRDIKAMPYADSHLFPDTWDENLWNDDIFFLTDKHKGIINSRPIRALTASQYWTQIRLFTFVSMLQKKGWNKITQFNNDFNQYRQEQELIKLGSLVIKQMLKQGSFITHLPQLFKFNLYFHKEIDIFLLFHQAKYLPMTSQSLNYLLNYFD